MFFELSSFSAKLFCTFPCSRSISTPCSLSSLERGQKALGNRQQSATQLAPNVLRQLFKTKRKRALPSPAQPCRISPQILPPTSHHPYRYLRSVHSRAELARTPPLHPYRFVGCSLLDCAVDCDRVLEVHQQTCKH